MSAPVPTLTPPDRCTSCGALLGRPWSSGHAPKCPEQMEDS
jgi:DNA-directed RNA polymerase subunit N (RpoN/RPB10)